MLLLQQTSSLRNNFSIRNWKSTKYLATRQSLCVLSGNYFLITEFINKCTTLKSNYTIFNNCSSKDIDNLLFEITKNTDFSSFETIGIVSMALALSEIQNKVPTPNEIIYKLRHIGSTSSLIHCWFFSIFFLFLDSFYNFQLNEFGLCILLKNIYFKKYKTMIRNNHFFYWKAVYPFMTFSRCLSTKL